MLLSVRIERGGDGWRWGAFSRNGVCVARADRGWRHRYQAVRGWYSLQEGIYLGRWALSKEDGE